LFVVPFLYKYYSLFAFTKEQFDGDWSDSKWGESKESPALDTHPTPALAMNSSS
jgi:hypothetical protein